MKILIDGRLYGLENAGLGRYVMKLVEELQNIDDKNNYTILLRDKHFNRLELNKNWKKINADFRHYSFIEQIKLPLIVKQEKPDIVHFPHLNVPIFGVNSFVVTIHDLLMNKDQGKKATTLPLPMYYLKRIGYFQVIKRAIKGSGKIIVPTESVKEEIIKKYKVNKRKISVTYEGIDSKFFNAKFPKIDKKYKFDFPYFIYVGNAYPHKNLDRAIEAITKLKEEEVKLVIVTAKGNFKTKLRNSIERLKANDRVVLLDFVSDEELKFLLHASVGYVFPSLLEGFGLPGLEAMASGTIVLASNIPVFKEVYKDAAIYFNQYDFTAIARAMEIALNMKNKKRDKLISKGEKLAKQYSWKKMAKETLEVYKEVYDK